MIILRENMILCRCKKRWLCIANYLVMITNDIRIEMRYDYIRILHKCKPLIRIFREKAVEFRLFTMLRNKVVIFTLQSECE